MAINYIKGEMLSADLLRGGVDLSFDGGVLHVDVNNNRVGVNTQVPAVALDVAGDLLVSNGIAGDSATLTSSLQAGNVFIGTNTITTVGDELLLTSSSNKVAVLGDIRFNSVTANLLSPDSVSALSVVTVANPDIVYNLTNILPTPPVSYAAESSPDAPYGFYMTPDGLTIFYVDDDVVAATTNVYQTPLTIAYDLSSASIATTTVISTTEVGAAHGITFNPNGLEMYISKFSGANTIVERFTVSVAFDLSSTIVRTGSGTFGNSATFNFAPAYSANGLKAYVGSVSTTTKYIDEYTLSTAYDLASTVTWVARHDISTEIIDNANYISVAMSADGLEMFAAQYDGANNQIASYILDVANDIAGSTITNGQAATPGSAGEVRSMYFTYAPSGAPTAGDALYWIDSNDLVYEYDTHTVAGNATTELNYNGNERLATNALGVSITGSLDFSGADSLLTPPTYTTATLPSAPTEGGTIYDSTTKTIKYFDGTNWAGTGTVTGVKMYVLTAATVNATLTEALDINSNPLDLADNTTWRFEVNVVARRTDAGGVESSGYKFTGVIARDTGAASVVGVVAETIDAEDDATWSVAVDANVNSLRVQVTGAVGKDISWVVFVRTVEVSD